MPSNPLKSNKILYACVHLLRLSGADHITYARGGKHLKLSAVSPDGLLITSTIPCSTSDWRSAKNTLADVKRQLRRARPV